MNFENKNLKKTNTLFTIFGEGFEKSTKCILCDKNLKKKSFVCTICGEGFEKYVSGRTKVQSEQSERNWHHVRLGSTYRTRAIITRS